MLSAALPSRAVTLGTRDVLEERCQAVTFGRHQSPVSNCAVKAAVRGAYECQRSALGAAFTAPLNSSEATEGHLLQL